METQQRQRLSGEGGDEEAKHLLFFGQQQEWKACVSTEVSKALVKELSDVGI